MKVIRSLLIISTIFLVPACSKDVFKVKVFDTTIRLNTQLVSKDHHPSFLQLINVNNLYSTVGHNLTPAQISKITSALLSKTNENKSINNVVQLYLYTNVSVPNHSVITTDNTHAFSIFSLRNNSVDHLYFEKDISSTYQKIPTLSKEVDGAYSVDDIRMLHFAKTGKMGIPKQSTIYEFAVLKDNDPNLRRNFSKNFRITLLDNNDRNWGASTIGLYGDEIYKPLMDDKPTPDTCGPDPGCPTGNTGCYTDPIAGTKKYCETDDDGCLAATLARNFSNLFVDMKRMWNIRDGFLAKYELGRKYIKYYYIGSLFVKLDNNALQTYSKLLPDLYRSIDLLLSQGNEDSVIVTSRMHQNINELIRIHKDVNNSRFQEILNSIEKDINVFKGMKKSEFTGMLDNGK